LTQYQAGQNIVRTVTFDGNNKQKYVVENNQGVGEYFYDGEGKRVKKKVYNPNGSVREETVFVYSAGKLVEEYSSTTEPAPTNPTTKWTATDQLGSPRVITDSLGNVVSRRDFLPFGEEITNNIGERQAASLKYNVADGVRQKFTGYQKDDETGLDFAEARMYENRHGRFTAVDPLLASGKSANPQTFNRYVYCLNNPLIFTDPDGLQVGKWFYPVDAEGNPTNGKYKYIRNGQSTEGYREVTQRNRKGELIGASTSVREGYVVRFNPFGPASVNNPLDLDDLILGDKYVRSGWDEVMSDELYDELYESMNGDVNAGLGVQTAISPLDITLLVTPFRVGLLSKGTVSTGALALEQTGASTVTKSGILSGSLNGLTQAERSMVSELLAQGKNVSIVPRSAIKTPDFLVNGVSTELKTLTSAGTNTLKNAIQKATKQGQQILVDARNVNISPEDAMKQILRVEGNGYVVKGRVTIFTNGGTVTY
ncbi:hypothetical protein H6S82_01495, partial [Planktothrix sp. FACHB-1355]|uniref:RHS repeat-associated core domain-containing protein n=1 Tax=Planktothrix sp. FACHB-1355 TaxID=2692854 RepID=UPI0018EFEF50